MTYTVKGRIWAISPTSSLYFLFVLSTVLIEWFSSLWKKGKAGVLTGFLYGNLCVKRASVKLKLAHWSRLVEVKFRPNKYLNQLQEYKVNLLSFYNTGFLLLFVPWSEGFPHQDQTAWQQLVLAPSFWSPTVCMSCKLWNKANYAGQITVWVQHVVCHVSQHQSSHIKTVSQRTEIVCGLIPA